MTESSFLIPPDGTIERWAFDYINSPSLSFKLNPPKPPSEWDSSRINRRLISPARPPELTVATKGPKALGRESLKNPLKRAHLIHTFFHHELQAAELMCWALLAFADTEESFRKGLLGIIADEIRHMDAYVQYLSQMGHSPGAFPVRDWFWERVPLTSSPSSYLAVMGMGFEGGNLDHAQRFGTRLREVGDNSGAAIQDMIGSEEIGHVRFALHWFAQWNTTTDFDTWLSFLPPPLSPVLMRGNCLNRESRKKAGMSESFLNSLASWTDRSPST